jgi:hypothetical protein
MSVTRQKPLSQAINEDRFTVSSYSRLNKVVQNLAPIAHPNLSHFTGWPLISVLALAVYWLSGRPDATFPFLCCLMRASFTTICILASLQAPQKAFKTPAKYILESFGHLTAAGLVRKFLVARSASSAQASPLIADVHYIICSLVFSMAGIPQISTLPLPATANGCCWLLSMFASTILGIILPTLRWYLYNGADKSEAEEALEDPMPKAPWDVLQISFVGCCTISAVWVTLAQIAALIE